MEANTLLTSYYQPLRDNLNNENICSELRASSPNTNSSILTFQLQALSVAHWLSTGQFESELAKRALDEIENDEDYKSNFPPCFNSAILSAIEADERNAAETRYSRWETKPIVEP
jgi:hypothetical protein